MPAKSLRAICTTLDLSIFLKVELEVHGFRSGRPSTKRLEIGLCERTLKKMLFQTIKVLFLFYMVWYDFPHSKNFLRTNKNISGKLPGNYSGFPSMNIQGQFPSKWKHWLRQTKDKQWQPIPNTNWEQPTSNKLETKTNKNSKQWQTVTTKNKQGQFWTMKTSKGTQGERGKILEFAMISKILVSYKEQAIDLMHMTS